MKPEYNVTCFTASVRNISVAAYQRKECVMQRGYCVIRHGYCDGYPAMKKDRQAFCFLFGRGNSVESESLELELESAKTFACHMLLGE